MYAAHLLFMTNMSNVSKKFETVLKSTAPQMFKLPTTQQLLEVYSTSLSFSPPLS